MRWVDQLALIVLAVLNCALLLVSFVVLAALIWHILAGELVRDMGENFSAIVAIGIVQFGCCFLAVQARRDGNIRRFYELLISAFLPWVFLVGWVSIHFTYHDVEQGSAS